jgi:hypothetical protein
MKRQPKRKGHKTIVRQFCRKGLKCHKRQDTVNKMDSRAVSTDDTGLCLSLTTLMDDVPICNMTDTIISLSNGNEQGEAQMIVL